MVNLPKSCEVNRFIPKNTFYTKTDISNSLKQEFTDKVEKIYWRYKISLIKWRKFIGDIKYLKKY